MGCEHYGFELQETDRHYVKSKRHNNCVFCLVNDKGKMTQAQTARYLGVCKMRVCQIERRAVKRFTRKFGMLDEKDFMQEQ